MQPITNVEGLTRLISKFGHDETKRRLVEAVGQQGMVIVADIDHASAARLAGQHLRPTSVLVFGNALAGTPLMQVAPTFAIDLPLKALVWTDEDGATCLDYVDPVWLASRHGVEAATEPVLDRMRRALAIAADHATQIASE